jgi:serine/threonine protein kinase
MTPGFISRTLQPICSALNYSHQCGVFHCDVKPANILIQHDGQAFLTDFGVAMIAEESEKSGGTPPYMAPEQFLGQTITARTDVYALGIVFYEMLSGGKVPFRGDSFGSPATTLRDRIAWEHLNLPIPPLRQVNPGIPVSIENVISKALDKNPEKRYPTVMALWDAFEQARSLFSQPNDNIPATKDKNQYFPPSNYIPPVPLPKPGQPTIEPKKEEVRPAAKPSVLKGNPYLLWRAGERTGQVILIPRSGLTVGRSEKNLLKISEASVSRVHANLLCTRHGIFIRDESSSMGTFVNGKKIQSPTRLYSGDIIQIGYYQIFEFHER